MGQGKSFMPMLSRLLAGDRLRHLPRHARAGSGQKAGQGGPAGARGHARPARVLGEFDLVWALDDAINYLLSPGNWNKHWRGCVRNLAPTGLLLFDVNELQAYRTFFAEKTVVERGGRLPLVWRGLSSCRCATGLDL